MYFPFFTRERVCAFLFLFFCVCFAVGVRFLFAVTAETAYVYFVMVRMALHRCAFV